MKGSALRASIDSNNGNYAMLYLRLLQRKAPKMPTLATVTKTGNSATIVLPSDLRKANGIHIGDQLELVSRPDGVIELKKVKGKKEKQALFEEAVEFFESVECKPWPGDCSKESDRELMGERYAD